MESLEAEVGRVDIPGLPESDKGRRGKKKGSNKNKTLSLQTFLQDGSQETGDSEESSETEAASSYFSKLRLNEEEQAVMESCHSFIHDLLKQLGPSNAMDPILQQEINNFPPEAKSVLQKCGGYRNFILQSKDLVVVDKIVSARSDLEAAQEMAFKEIFNKMPGATTSSKVSSYSNSVQNSNRVRSGSTSPPGETSRHQANILPTQPNILPMQHQANLQQHPVLTTQTQQNPANILPPQKSVKDIWNSRQSSTESSSGVWNHNNVPQSVESSRGIWGNSSGSTDTRSFQLQLPKFDSLFNENDALHSESFSKSTSILNSNAAYSRPSQNQEPDFPVDDNEPHSLLGGNRITGSGFSSVFGSSGGSSALSNLAKSGNSDKKSPDENSDSAAQRLMKGFCPDGFFSSDVTENKVSGEKPQWEKMRQLEANNQQKIIEDFQQRVWKLSSHNNDLLKQLAEKETQTKEFLELQSKYMSLESQYHSATNELAAVKNELNKLRLQRNEQGNNSLTNGDVVTSEIPSEIKTKIDSDREVILSLQKQLEMEQLRTRNLTQELQIERETASSKSRPPGLSLNQPRQLSRQHGSVPMLCLGAPGMDEDPFGLRRMMQNGPINPSGVSSNPGPLNTRGQSSMFGPIIGPDFSAAPPHSHPLVNQSNSGPGIVSDPERGTGGSRSSHTPGRSSHTPSPTTSPVPPPSHGFPSASTGFQPSQLFSQPPPAAAQAAIGTAAAAGTTKIARQEQLVKKLVATLPGSTGEQIRQYIQVLRVKHGKLSGWPTSKIASHIAELMKNETSGHQ